MRQILYIDLSKGRPKGSQNKKHKYIARILLSDGNYAYITPDDDEGHFEHSGGQWLFRLAQGKSLASIINRHIWGGYTGETDKFGRPKAPDGIFRHYEVVHKKRLEQEKLDAKRTGKTLREDAISKQTVGDYIIFTYPLAPQIGRDADGKPRYGGYVDIHWNSAVTGKYRYEEPKELKRYHAETPDDIAAAQRVSDFIPEGEQYARPDAKPFGSGGSAAPRLVIVDKDAATGKPTGAHMTDVAGGDDFRNRPKTSEETKQLLGLPLDEDVDPLSVAKMLRDKLLFNREAKIKGKKVKIEKFPEWAVAPFGSEESLLEHMRERPITTMVTLGIVKPTKYSTKVNERLEQEWRGEIVRGARLGWESHKYTEQYKKWKQLDDADGLDATDENSRVRKNRATVQHDLIQDAGGKLHEVAMTYTPDKGPFHAYMRVVLRNYMTALSTRWAKEKHLHVDLVEDHNVEEAAHKMQQTAPLGTADAAELDRVTPLALGAMKRVLLGSATPEAYRNVIMSRLNLDDPREEAARLREHESTEAEKRATAAIEGKTYKRESFKTERDWEEVYHRHKPWTDPETGKVRNDLDDRDSSTRFRWLSRWYKDGIDHIKRELSEPAPKSKDKSQRTSIMVNARETDYTHEELLAQATLGKKGDKQVRRVLTHEGEAFKRYVEIKTQLAATARRQHGTKQEDIAREAYPDIKDSELDRTWKVTQRKLPEHSTKPLKHVLLIPSAGDTHRTTHAGVGFFSAQKNRQLATKLGINLGNIDPVVSQGKVSAGSTRSGVWVQPNVSLGKLAQRELSKIEGHYGAIEKYRKMNTAKIEEAHKRSAAMRDALQGIGGWKQSAQGSVWVEKESPLVHKDAAGKEHRGLSAMHEAARDVHRAVSVIREKEAKRSAIRAEFKDAQRAMGPVEDQLGLNTSVLKHKLKPHLPTEKELKAVEKAKKRYESISNKIGALVPEIKTAYDEALNTGAKLGASHLSIARAKLAQSQSKHRNNVTLLDFVMEEKKLRKGIDADDLVVALYAYDFELGRYHAEMAA